MKQFAITIVVLVAIYAASRYGAERSAPVFEGYSNAGVAAVPAKDKGKAKAKAPAKKEIVSLSNSPYIGVSSCAATGCHGGPLNDESRDRWNSSYSIWATEDVHANAFSILWDERSRGIIEKLIAPAYGTKEEHAAFLKSLDDDASYLKYLKESCTSCHATHDPKNGSSDALLADGVSCESCHGAAKGWLAEHTSSDWITADAATKFAKWEPSEKEGWVKTKSTWGMNDTRDIITRAKICTDCHIGSVDDQGRPWRDLDHRIMAAGHPPLDFEFAAYLQNIPAHWDKDDDRKFKVKDRHLPDSKRAKRVDFEMEVWSAGQAVSLLSRMSLLHARANDTVNHGNEDWPELAETGCYACHHDLGETSFRQKLGYDFRPGDSLWESWHVPMSKFLAEHYGLKTEVGSVTTLQKQMGPWNIGAAVAAKASAAAIPAAHNLVKAVIGKTPNSKELMQQLAVHEFKRPTWSDMTQWYLAVSSAHESIISTRTAKNDADTELASEMAKLAKLLDFPIDMTDSNNPTWYDSPRDFDPTSSEFAEVEKKIRALMKQVSKP